MELSTNWGRWGDDDDRGTLNLIEGEQIVRASRLIRNGHIYRLALPMQVSHSSPLVEDGLTISRDMVQPPSASEREVAVDVISTHTHNFTHVDALSHCGYGGRFYNGRRPTLGDDTSTDTLSADRIKAIVGRAVLADIARARGVDALAAGDVITPEDLDRALASADVVTCPGDVLLLRTGWINAFMAAPEIAHKGWPGLGHSTVDWLNDHQIAAIAADTPGVEVMPFEDPEREWIVHERFIRDLGGYLIEYVDLEEVTAAGCSEGFFVLAPLRLVGASGSPATPLLLV